MMKRLIFSTFLLLAALGTAAAQGVNEMRINEVLVKNVDNYEDDYGHRSSWIELHNESHSTIDIGGLYLRATTDSRETLYRIPPGDPRTKISPLGYVVFFCEGTGTKGTLYTNFTLEDVNSIALLNSSGEGEPIHEIAIDYEAQLPDISIGFTTGEEGEVAFGPLSGTTPNATNDTEPLLARSERFRQMDPHGGMMAAIAIIVVMSVLALLFVFFKLLGNYMVMLSRKKTEKAKPDAVVQEKGKTYESLYSSEQIAAITTALQMYWDELHDKESAVLTINKVARAYSPWSSKIYGLRQFNKK